MSIFAFSDLHLSLSSDKPMDVFHGWDNYVERIETNWKAIVNSRDTVVIPGDISWEMKLESTYNDFNFINSLPGNKIILKGNHDLWWNSMIKMTTFLSENKFDSIKILHNNCFEVEDIAICGSRGWFFDDESADKKIILREAGRVETSIKKALETGKKPILFLHYPPVNNFEVCDEIMDVIKKYGIKNVFYGHIHKSGSAKMFNGEYEGITFKCVSCDMLDFIPYKLRNLK